jgi:tetratricopeptide (TPR) repeat protein
VPRRKASLRPIALAASVVVALGLGAWVAASGCSGWDPTKPFERNAPEVDQALADLDAGKLESAADALQRYLGTGPCTDAGLGLPDLVRQRPDGSFDLGLVLFGLGERFGQRFGDETPDGGSPDEEAARGMYVDCALIAVRAIAADAKVPIELRARAYYLAGNLEFLRRQYEKAVELYDDALALVPGVIEEAGGDPVGRDAAWNRAIALRRIEEQKDAGQDAEPDANDSGQDAEPDGGDDAGPPDAGGDDGGQDGGDDQSQPDGGQDQEPDAGEPESPDGGSGQDGGRQDKEEPEPPPEMQQDDRVLDRLEEAPTYQEQEAKSRAGVRRGRPMEDK